MVPVDTFHFKHGMRHNEDHGGTCAEFLQINNLSQCCQSRDDNCYIIHYETRCYCDIFCDRNSDSDCCPDASHGVCNNIQPNLFTEHHFKHGTTTHYRKGLNSLH